MKKQPASLFPIFKVDLRNDFVREIVRNDFVASSQEKLDRTYCLVACPKQADAMPLALDHLFGNRRTTDDFIFHSMILHFEEGVGTNVIPVITKNGYNKEKFSYCSSCHCVFYTRFNLMCNKCSIVEREAQIQYDLLDKELGVK